MTDTHTPGRDERGMYWFDCGCHINGIMSIRCELHGAAAALLAALKEALAQHPGMIFARLAIEKAEGAQGEGITAHQRQTPPAYHSKG